MYREIHWTDEAEDHIARHDVEPHEVEEVVSGRPKWVIRGWDGTMLILGAAVDGRGLMVCLANRSRLPGMSSSLGDDTLRASGIQGESEMKMSEKRKRGTYERVAEHYDEHELTEEELEAGHLEAEEAPPLDQQMIGTSLRLPKPVMDLVREHAAAQGIRPTAYMRQVIEASVADQDMSIPLSVLLSAAMEWDSTHRRAS